MKFATTFQVFGMLIMFLGLITMSVSAQNPAQPGSQDPSQSQMDQNSPSQQQAQTFTGTLVKSKGNFMLKDQSSGSTYKLDVDSSAKRFVGKAVKLMGTLDPSSNTIHVSNIETTSNQ